MRTHVQQIIKQSEITANAIVSDFVNEIKQYLVK